MSASSLHLHLVIDIIERLNTKLYDKHDAISPPMVGVSALTLSKNILIIETYSFYIM
jgi:hypothetical protein